MSSSLYIDINSLLQKYMLE